MDTRKAAMRAASICLRAAVLIAIILTIVFIGKTTYQYTRAVFSDAAMEEKPGKAVSIKIPEDISSKKFAEVLEENGLVESAKVLVIQMKMADFGDTVKAGTYELNTSMSPSQMFKVLSKETGDE